MEKEKDTFLKKCSKEDQEKISGMRKMSYEDFERLTYLAASLGFAGYEVELYNTFGPNFQKKYEAQVREWQRDGWESEEPEEIEAEMAKRASWLEEFIEHKE